MSLTDDARHYRTQAADCQRMIDGLDPTKASDRVELTGFVKDRDLWIQMAHELETYLATAEEHPPLF